MNKIHVGSNSTHAWEDFALMDNERCYVWKYLRRKVCKATMEVTLWGSIDSEYWEEINQYDNMPIWKG
jgi:hypothetical protein